MQRLFAAFSGRPDAFARLAARAFPAGAVPGHSIRVFGIADAAVIGSALNDAGIAVQGLYAHRRDLEEFFVGLMGDEYRG